MKKFATVNEHTGSAGLLGGVNEVRAFPHLDWVEIANPRADGAYLYRDNEWVPPSLAYLKKQVQGEAAAFRKRVERGGVTHAGVAVGTAIEDRLRLGQLLADMERHQIDAVDFKALDGWTRLNYGRLKAIDAAVARHVQACFSIEKAHHDSIEALSDIAGVNSYDLAVGWPGPA